MGKLDSPRMPLGKRQRKWVLALGIFFGVLLLICLTIPIWFPWVLSPFAGRHGVQYSRYERHGFRRFAVYQAGFTNQSIRFHADRIETLTPPVWLWRAATGKGAGPWVRVEGWSLEPLSLSNAPASPKGTPSLVTNLENIARSLPRFERWLPAATLSNGSVVLPSGSLEIPAAAWTRGQIWASAGFREHQGTVRVRLAKTLPYELQFQSETLHLQATMQLTTNGDGLVLRGRSLWWSNRVDLQAEFAREGLLPERASVQVPNLRVAPQWIGLEDYYREVRGSVSGTWENGQYQVVLNAAARPLQRQTNVPPFQVDLRAHGDTNGLAIQTAVVQSPWLKAELSRELKVHFSREFFQEPAALAISADLSQQHGFPWTGKLKGTAEVSPGAGRIPQGRFELTAADLGPALLKANTATIKAVLDWPWINLQEGAANFDDGSRATIRGRFDITNRALADTTMELAGPLPNRWLPQGYRLESCAVKLEGEGALNAIAHRGHLTANQLGLPLMQTLHVETDWRGTNLDFSMAKLAVAAGQARMSLEGAVRLRAGEAATEVKQWIIDQGGSNLFALAHPVEARITTGKPWRIELTPLELAAPGRSLQARGFLSWPGAGGVVVQTTNFQTDWLAGWLSNKVETVVVQHLGAEVRWSNGPAIFGVDLRASGLAESAFPLTTEAQFGSDGRFLTITNLAVSSVTSVVSHIRGRLPISFRPGASNPVSIDFQSELQLDATTEPRALIWEKLAQWTGVVLREPACDIHVAGTWAAPSGAIHLQARQMQFRQTSAELPSLENLNLDVQLDRDRARVINGGLIVQGQPVSLTAEFPLGEAFWKRIREKKLPDWEDATAHLLVDNAQLAAFAPLLPQVLSPQGELDLDVSLVPGGKLDGTLSVRGARTRPLGNLGPVRDISVQMKFVERALKLEAAHAYIGGAPAVVTGSADLSGTGWLHGIGPPFQLALRGTNVPLSRQPESVIRADIDLAVSKTNTLPPLISGTMNLRDSFYLRDVRDLVPGKVAAPSRRPPYFSVNQPPFADWRLAARVSGLRFLKVRSTLFNGEISANLKLEGTLLEPVALGDLKIESGVVRFPFASLAVKQGFVTLNSSDPHRPRLEVQAESKKFGYELKMDASGPVDAPIVQFSSTPPLNSEQIVMMLTAGEVPHGTYVLSPQQKAQTVAVFFGRDLLARLGLGDDSEDRLMFQSGEQISEQGRPTYNVEYKVTDRWSIVGEYDRFNAFNAGLKWRVYSR